MVLILLTLLLFDFYFCFERQKGSCFVCLLSAVSFLGVRKILQHCTGHPAEGQNLEHLIKGCTMFIISNIVFLILFWPSTKQLLFESFLCQIESSRTVTPGHRNLSLIFWPSKSSPGNFSFLFVSTQLSHRFLVCECLKKGFDFVTRSVVALDVSISMAMVHVVRNVGEKSYVPEQETCQHRSPWALPCWFREMHGQ